MEMFLSAAVVFVPASFLPATAHPSKQAALRVLPVRPSVCPAVRAPNSKKKQKPLEKKQIWRERSRQQE